MQKKLQTVLSVLVAVLLAGSAFFGLSDFPVFADNGYSFYNQSSLPVQSYREYSEMFGECLKVSGRIGGGLHIEWKNGSTNHRIPIGKEHSLNALQIKFEGWEQTGGADARVAVYLANNPTFQYSMYGDSCVLILDATEGVLYTVRHGGGNPKANVWVPIISDSKLSYENLKQREFTLLTELQGNGGCKVTIAYDGASVSGIIPSDIFDYITDTDKVYPQFSAMANGNDGVTQTQQINVIGYRNIVTESLFARIEALPAEITPSEAGEVSICQMLYTGLSAAEQQKITNIAKLNDAVDQVRALGDLTGWTELTDAMLFSNYATVNGYWPGNFHASDAEPEGIHLDWTNGSTNHRISLKDPVDLDKLQIRFNDLRKKSGTLARFAIYLWNNSTGQYSMYRDCCVIVLDAASGILYSVKYGGGSPNGNTWVPIVTDDRLKYESIGEREFRLSFQVLKDGTCKVTVLIGKNEISGVIPANDFDFITDSSAVYLNFSAMANGTDGSVVNQSLDVISYKEYKPSIADELVAKIDALPEEITRADVAAVNVIDAAYQNLDMTSQMQVTNYPKLESALQKAAALQDFSAYTVITGNADLYNTLEGFSSQWAEFSMKKVANNGGVRAFWKAAPANRRFGFNRVKPLDGLHIGFNRLVRLSGKASKLAVLLSDTMAVQYSRYTEILALVLDFETGTVSKVDYNSSQSSNELTKLAESELLAYENIAGKPFEIGFDRRTDGGYDITLYVDGNEAVKTLFNAADMSKVSNASDGVYFVFSSFSEAPCTQVLDLVGYRYEYRSEPDAETAAVIDAINGLPTAPSVSDGDAIRAVKAQYEGLKSYQKLRVSNYDVLTGAIANYSQELKKISRYDADGWYIPDLKDCGLLTKTSNDYVPPAMSEIDFNGGLHQEYFYAGYDSCQSINRSFRLDGLTVRFENFTVHNKCNGIWLYVQTSTNHIAYWANSSASAYRGIAVMFGRDSTLYINGGSSAVKEPLITDPSLSPESLQQNPFTIGFELNGETVDVIVTVGENEPLRATVEEKRFKGAKNLNTDECWLSTVCNYTAGDGYFKGSIDVTGLKFEPYSEKQIAEWTAVIEKINALPQSPTVADLDKILAANEAYLNLSKPEMRAFVTNYAKLTGALAAVHAQMLNDGLDVYNGKTIWYLDALRNGTAPAPEPETEYVIVSNSDEGGAADPSENQDRDEEPETEVERVLKKRLVKTKGSSSDSDDNTVIWIVVAACAAAVVAGGVVLLLFRRKKR